MTTRPQIAVRPGGEAPAVREQEHARELAGRLAARGLRTSAEPLGSPAGAMSVAAQRVDVDPYVGRVVVLLPFPHDSGELYWHWRRPFPQRQWVGACWFQPFCPVTEPEAAADAIAGTIDIDVRSRARAAHVAAVPGSRDAEFEERFLTRLGRPLHLLVYRTLALLDSVEREVEDTDLLHELFKIDHLTTRALRGLERQAVLGGATARGVREAVTLATVMRQAVAQIEHYPRVRVRVPSPGEDADLPGYAGTEITLLLAELVENATKFSPPDTEVQMTAGAVPSGAGIEITVTDRGLPMSADTYAALNRMLADPDTVSLREQIIAGPIGLLVVSKLARRHRIQVALHPVTPSGTRAVVTLPAALLSAPRPIVVRPARPAVMPPARMSGTGARLNHAAASATPAAPSPLILPGGAVTSSTSLPGTAELAATHVAASGDAGSRPVLPQRRRRGGQQGLAADAAPTVQGGRHAPAPQAAGPVQGPEPERGSKRGPNPRLLTDFAGAARRRQLPKDPTGQGHAGSAPASWGSTTAPTASADPNQENLT
ncbi:sensor histidine kinase [Actinomadura geliboluensis]|uniref:histidine kinase n=1 Tax=Actinomadura geliboluensis TaxID=882440 RepID=A0A5S4GZU4_9ACTN|nr:ATP-binding protein [Actinomadura geliboluensis]TMR38182.1 sensor histidine kinase [Actinomadura geliboluensis]